MCTYANNMSDPKKQIPQSIVTGGIVIAAIYLFSAFGIGAAVDVREISVDSGLIDAVSLILGGSGGVLVGVVALLFLVTLFGNMISWSMGVNSTAALAADHNDMPRVFIFTAVPLSFDAETLASFLPITIGSILSVAIGEVLIALRGKNARS